MYIYTSIPQQLALEEKHLIDLFGGDIYIVTYPLLRAFRQYQEI